MASTSKIGYLLERLSQGVAAHDRENPDHNTWGIGMAYFDIERLGLEEGEEILPGIVLQADGGMSGQFRILCDGDHGQEATGRVKRSSRRSSSEEIAEPVEAPGTGPAPKIIPPF